MSELKRIVARWNHERDRMIYIHPDGREEKIYDSGCGDWCRRCQIEQWIAKQERAA